MPVSVHVLSILNSLPSFNSPHPFFFMSLFSFPLDSFTFVSFIRFAPHPFIFVCSPLLQNTSIFTLSLSLNLHLITVSVFLFYRFLLFHLRVHLFIFSRSSFSLCGPFCSSFSPRRSIFLRPSRFSPSPSSFVATHPLLSLLSPPSPSLVW